MSTRPGKSGATCAIELRSPCPPKVAKRYRKNKTKFRGTATWLLAAFRTSAARQRRGAAELCEPRARAAHGCLYEGAPVQAFSLGPGKPEKFQRPSHRSRTRSRTRSAQGRIRPGNTTGVLVRIFTFLGVGIFPDSFLGTSSYGKMACSMGRW